MSRSDGNGDRIGCRAPLCLAAFAAVVVAAAPAKAQTTAASPREANGASVEPSAQTPVGVTPFVTRSGVEPGPAAPTPLTLTGPQNPPPAPAPAKAFQGPVVIVEADNVVQDKKAGLVTAMGNVVARYQGRTLRADKVVYDMNKKTVHATGKVEISDPDGSVRYADETETDDKLNAGVATRFGARLQSGGTLAAGSLVRRENGQNVLNNVVYTGCAVCAPGGKGSPSWTIRARRVVQDPDDKMLYYRNMLLNIRGVPVFYLPWFASPDPTKGAHSGLLPPDFGVNTRLGVFYDQPYYWRISDYQDLTVSAQYMSKINPLLGVDYRKRFWSGDLRIKGSFTSEKDFTSSGARFGDEAFRGHIFGYGAFDLNDYWRWSFGVERTTDDLYLRRYGIEAPPRYGEIQTSDLTRLVSQVSLTGQDASSYMNLAFLSFQGLRQGDASDTLPFVLPIGEANKVLRDPIFDGQLKLKASTANITRDDGPDSARVSSRADWDVQHIVGPGIIFNPFAQARGDVYRLQDQTTTANGTVSRALGLAGAVVRWPFIRPSEKVSLILEPIVMAEWASPATHQNDIPNEDSQAFELDDSDIFRPNAAPNYDRWSPGPQVAVGARATAKMQGTTLSAVFGRRWRSDADPNFDVASNLNGHASDYVGAISGDIGPRLGGMLRFRLDDRTLALRRIDASVRTSIWRVFANARYYNISNSLAGGNPSEEISGTLGLRVTKHWSVSYGLRRDLDSNINLSQDTHLMYRDDCLFVDFTYSRTETRDRTLGPTDGFHIRLGLNTLGVFGD